MSKIGYLNKSSDGSYEAYKGQLRTIEYNLKLLIERDPEQYDENSPTHVVFALIGEDKVPIGVGWRKEIQRGPQFGEEFLSITLSDPSFREPLNVSAFKDKNGDGFEIVYRRPRQS
ncbi:MAG: DUF736 domain-containing protein [Pseudomonadota bacterium]